MTKGTGMTDVPAADQLALASIGGSSDQSRWRTESLRTHASPRLVVITKGQGRVNILGKTSGFGPNNVIFVPPKTLYGLEMGATAFGTVVTIPPALQSDWPEECVHLRLRDVAAIKDLQSYLDALERELKSPASGAERAALYRLGLLAVFFMRQFETYEAPSSTESAADRLVAAYAGLIARDYASSKGVAGYAADLGITPTHLNRCCRKVSGRSALALLNERVMYEARVRLRNSRTPVAHIAQELGFASPAYFTRAFQQAAGVTPSAFRARGPVAVS